MQAQIVDLPPSPPPHPLRQMRGHEDLQALHVVRNAQHKVKVQESCRHLPNRGVLIGAPDNSLAHSGASSASLQRREAIRIKHPSKGPSDKSNTSYSRFQESNGRLSRFVDSSDLTNRSGSSSTSTSSGLRSSSTGNTSLTSSSNRYFTGQQPPGPHKGFPAFPQRSVTFSEDSVSPDSDGVRIELRRSKVRFPTTP